MGKLGKILAPIVAVLAIGAAVFSVLVGQGFVKYRDRASKMAQGLVDTTNKLDAQTNSGTSAKIKFTAQAPGVKESGSLAYSEFKKDPGKFEADVASVGKLAQDVNNQRNEMADTIAAMTISLGLGTDSLPTDDLKALNSYSACLKLAKDYAEAFNERDKEFVDNIKQYASALRVSGINVIDSLPTLEENSETGERNVKRPSFADSLKGIKTAIDALNARKNAYEMAIINVKKVLKSYDDWTADPSRIGTATDYSKILNDLAADLANINGRLDELKRVKTELLKTQGELRQREKEITDLKASVEDLTAKNAEMVEKLKYYGVGVEDNRKDITSIDEVDPDTKGSVLLENKDWNYVIINLGKKAVAAGCEVIISLNGEYQATGKVTKVEEEVSLVEIIKRKASTIPTGAKVYMGSNVKGKVDDASPEDDN